MEPPFPPRDGRDVLAYDHAEVLAGYTSFERGDLVPGANHSPAFRWGWQNRQRDTGQDDGFDHIRRDFFRHRRR